MDAAPTAMTPGQKQRKDHLPTVSVVVPVRAGRRDLPACLDAIAASTLPPLEVLVIDDASRDDTAAIARATGVRVLELETNRGPAHARNRGVEIARGDVVFFVDADVRLHPEAIAIAAECLHRDPTLTAVFGSYDEQPSDPRFVSQYKNLFHHWVHQHSRDEASTFWTGCGAIRRDIYLAIGGLNEGYRRPSIEDIELGSRLRAAGCRIRLEKRMQASHSKRWRLWDLLRTDVMLRGAPWIALMLRDRRAPKELNLSSSSKVATVVAALLALSILALPALGRWPAVLPALASLLVSALVARFLALGRGFLRDALAVTGAVAAPIAAFSAFPTPLALLPFGLLVALVVSHVDLYAFFAQRRGIAFAIGVLPMHFLFQLCCAASVPLGIFEHLRDVRRARRAAEGPAIRELAPLAHPTAGARARGARA